MSNDERRPKTPPESSTKKTKKSLRSRTDSAATAASPRDENSDFKAFVERRCTSGVATDGQHFAVLRDRTNVALTVDRAVEELAVAWYAQHQRVASSRERSDAADLLRVLSNQNRGHPLRIRSAWFQDAGEVLIDPGDDSSEVIVVAAEGWSRAVRRDVLFRRARTFAALRVSDKPIGRKAGFALLRSLLPFDDPDVAAVVVALLLTSWLGGAAQPVVLFVGAAGSGKTTTARFLALLVDPTTHQRGGPLPANEQAWKAVANTARVLMFDNTGRITAMVSDQLCRVSTGGEMTTRRLYTDDEAHVTELLAPVWLTSVEPEIFKGDLATRTVMLRLPGLDRDSRTGESELLRAQREAAPILTRFLLDLMVEVLRLRDEESGHPSMHRLTELETVLRCVDRLLGTRGVDRLGQAAADLATEIIEGNPVAQEVVGHLPEVEGEHSPTHLHKLLTEAVGGERGRLPRNWPETPAVLSRRLSECGPELEQVYGIRLEWGRRGRSRDRFIRVSPCDEA